MQHQEILFQLADQAFGFDPPDGRPEETPAPAVQVLASGKPVAATAGRCTVNPAATTMHGDSQRGSTSLRVTSTAGFAGGRRYLVTKPEGEREWIDVVSVRDEQTLVLRHPMIHRYAGAATIVGCRISIAVDPHWVATAANVTDHARGLAGYVLRWTYALAGHEMTAISYADLVTVRADQLVTPRDVDARFPGWIANLPPAHRDNQGADFIAEAFRALRLEAIGDGHAQRRIRDTRILRELVPLRSHVIRLEHDVMHGERRSSELAVAEQRYRSSYSRLVEVPKLTAPPPPPPPPPPTAKPGKITEPGTPRRIPKLTRH